MLRKKFHCAKCDRSFSMKAHLVRHTTAKHGIGGMKRLGRPPGSGAKKRLGRPPGSGVKKRLGRPPGSGKRTVARGVSFGAGADLDAVVANMHAYRTGLLDQQRTLATQLDAMDRAISAMTGTAPSAARSPGRRGPGRPRGSAGSRGSKGTLATVIESVLRQHSRPMSPREIAKGVVKGGYKSNAKDLTKAVSNALPSIKAVKRLGFGKYNI